MYTIVRPHPSALSFLFSCTHFLDLLVPYYGVYTALLEVKWNVFWCSLLHKRRMTLRIPFNAQWRPLNLAEFVICAAERFVPINQGGNWNFSNNHLGCPTHMHASICRRPCTRTSSRGPIQRWRKCYATPRSSRHKQKKRCLRSRYGIPGTWYDTTTSICRYLEARSHWRSAWGCRHVLGIVRTKYLADFRRAL